MLCSLPVPISFACTFTIPLASISNVTSICGIPRGAGGIPDSWNRPRVVLSAAISLSPCITWMSTAVWLSAAVEKIWLFFVGIVVFLSISFVATPPNVSMDRDSGVTSRSSTSFTSPVSTPAWIAAPIATHSSGLMPLNGSLPVIFLTASCTAGILVDPPTRITLDRSLLLTPASAIAFFIGSMVAFTRSAVSWSNLALVISMFRCKGPFSFTVMNGRFTLVVCALDSSFLAFSAASFSLW